MKVEYINPFIDSTQEAFSTMLGTNVQRDKIGVATKPVKQKEIVGLIGISGRIKGVVSVAFPEETAIKITNAWLAMSCTDIDDTVKDAVAELVNIIAGGAKAKLGNGDEAPMSLSLPSIIIGEGFEVQYPSGTQWVELLFTSVHGSFFMRVTMEEAT